MAVAAAVGLGVGGEFKLLELHGHIVGDAKTSSRAGHVTGPKVSHSAVRARQPMVTLAIPTGWKGQSRLGMPCPASAVSRAVVGTPVCVKHAASGALIPWVTLAGGLKLDSVVPHRSQQRGDTSAMSSAPRWAGTGEHLRASCSIIAFLTLADAIRAPPMPGAVVRTSRGHYLAVIATVTIPTNALPVVAESRSAALGRPTGAVHHNVTEGPREANVALANRDVGGEVSNALAVSTAILAASEGHSSRAVDAAVAGVAFADAVLAAADVISAVGAALPLSTAGIGACTELIHLTAVNICVAGVTDAGAVVANAMPAAEIGTCFVGHSVTGNA